MVCVSKSVGIQNMKTCILIPSYNEALTIGHIVKEIKSMGLDVIVVDDGSTDSTEKIASENGAIAIRHPKNMGKGASLKDGFDFILKSTNYEAIIIMDGDGQHNPRDIHKFLSHAEKYDDDIIIGNRMGCAKDMPAVRYFTNRFMSSVLSAICKQDIPDTQCGYRLLRRRLIEQVKLILDKYDLESEILIKASRMKCKIASVPVESIYRNEASHIHPIKDTFRFLSLLLRSYFE